MCKELHGNFRYVFHKHRLRNKWVANATPNTCMLGYEIEVMWTKWTKECRFVPRFYWPKFTILSASCNIHFSRTLSIVFEESCLCWLMLLTYYVILDKTWSMLCPCLDLGLVWEFLGVCNLHNTELVCRISMRLRMRWSVLEYCFHVAKLFFLRRLAQVKISPFRQGLCHLLYLYLRLKYFSHSEHSFPKAKANYSLES